MNNFLTEIQRFFRQLFGLSPAEPSDEKILKNLMKALSMTEEQELGCDEVFELLDRYAELVVKNESARELMPLVAHHLEMCKHCKEEYDALIEVIGLGIP